MVCPSRWLFKVRSTTVLLAPDVSASVRSVSALINSHSSLVLFTPSRAYLVQDLAVPPSAVVITDRGDDQGLFHVRRGVIPRAPRSASVFQSIPQQIKRKQVHRLHRSLGHASPSRMANTIKLCPEVAPSLEPKDVRLFTSCSHANLKKNAPPSRSQTRATAIAYRLHADTSGIIRPSTSSGYRRVLVVVDDASRWFFVALLRQADMLSTSTALRSILRDASQGESVLRSVPKSCVRTMTRNSKMNLWTSCWLRRTSLAS